ncbi:uncharacterized protein LOC144108207 [Amblyomma americanum]
MNAGGRRNTPSSPFRCDDPALRVPLERDTLPTKPFLAFAGASGAAFVLPLLFRRPGLKPAEASYWAARRLRRFYVGAILLGDMVFTVQSVLNVKRPHFIDSCRPVVSAPNGTELPACVDKRLSHGTERGAGQLHRGTDSLGHGIITEVAVEPSTGSAASEPDKSGNVIKWPDNHAPGQDDVTTATQLSLDRVAGSRNVTAAAISEQSGTARRSLSGAPFLSKAPGSDDAENLRESSDLYYDIIVEATHHLGDVANYRCSGASSKKSGGSFPSGHASVAGFHSFFLFIQWHQTWSGLVRPLSTALLGVLFTAYSLMVCAQRVVQHQHHVIDVVCGLSTGVIVAAVFALWPYGNR